MQASYRSGSQTMFANPLRMRGKSHLGARSQGACRSTKRSFAIPAYQIITVLMQPCIIYAGQYRTGSQNSFCESAACTPRSRVKLACMRQVRVTSLQWDIPDTIMQRLLFNLPKYSTTKFTVCQYLFLFSSFFCFIVREKLSPTTFIINYSSWFSPIIMLYFYS